jgi:hypothetical protein
MRLVMTTTTVLAVVYLNLVKLRVSELRILPGCPDVNNKVAAKPNMVSLLTCDSSSASTCCGKSRNS